MKAALRKKLRQELLSLTTDFRTGAHKAISKNIIQADSFKKSRCIAVYMPIRGELDPSFIVTEIWRQGKKCFLPVILPDNQLVFAAYQANTKLFSNRFSILEPAFSAASLIRPEELDLVMVPLIGFNSDLYRLGQGGGYYDRTFAFTVGKNASQPKPTLCGLAYELQKTDDFSIEPWDIKLDAVVTEVKCYGTI